MKAIHYKGQNKFYLFDKPEEPRIDDFECAGSPRENLEETYNMEFEANLLAGKEIINPEVFEDWFTMRKGYFECIELKPGDIFDLPDNIGFKDDVMQNEFLMATACVRLFVKVRSLHNGIFNVIVTPDAPSGNFGRSVPQYDGLIKRQFKEAKSAPVESQDDMWNDVWEIFSKQPEDTKELKSKFTITRNL